MDTRGRFIEWRLGPLETLGASLSLATLAVGITLWSTSTFQDKASAAEVKMHLEKRIDNLEVKMATMSLSLEQVAKDVSYIRGRLEPKAKE